MSYYDHVATLGGDFQWQPNAVMVALVTDLYVFSPGHRYLTDIPLSAIVATAALTGRRIEGDVSKANPAVFLAARAGRVAGAVLYAAKPARDLSPIVAYYELEPLEADGSELTLAAPDGWLAPDLPAVTITKTSAPRSLNSADSLLPGGIPQRTLGQAFFERRDDRTYRLYGLVWVRNLQRDQWLMYVPGPGALTGVAKSDDVLGARAELAVELVANLDRITLLAHPTPSRYPAWHWIDVTGIETRRPGEPINGRGAADGGSILRT